MIYLKVAKPAKNTIRAILLRVHCFSSVTKRIQFPHHPVIISILNFTASLKLKKGKRKSLFGYELVDLVWLGLVLHCAVFYLVFLLFQASI